MQTAVAKLDRQMVVVADWMHRHPNTPPEWRRNIKPFLRNMANAVPTISSWRWLQMAIPRYSHRVQSPFGWVRIVLENPWGSFPEDRVAAIKEKERKRTQENLKRVSGSPSSSSLSLERQGHIEACPCALCHVDEVQNTGRCSRGSGCRACKYLPKA